MIKCSSSVIWKKGCSTVYCIFYDNLIYIGITQDFPFARWNNHFSKKGSFVEAIKKTIPEFDYKSQEIKIISLTLDDGVVKSTKELKALEKMLHINFDCNPFIKKTGYSIVSNTTRTAPRGFDYQKLTNQTIDLREKIEQLF